MPSGSSHPWFAPSWPDCLLERFSNGAMVFNPCSGATHHLNDLALWTMERLARQPATTAILVQELGEESAAALAAMEGLVGELARLGLLTPWER